MPDTGDEFGDQALKTVLDILRYLDQERRNAKLYSSGRANSRSSGGKNKSKNKSKSGSETFAVSSQGKNGKGFEEVSDTPAENYQLDFETVIWDEEAEIISNNLVDNDIPFTQERIAEDVIRFTFHKDSLPAIQEIANWLANHDRPVSESRFDFHPQEIISPQVQESGKDEALVTTINNPTAAQILKDEFAKEGIPFESFKEKDSGHERFVVSKSDLNKHTSKLKNITERVKDMDGQQVKLADEKAQKKVKDRKPSKEVKAEYVKNKNGIGQNRGYQKGHTKATPIRDEKEAKRSAHVRNTNKKIAKKSIKKSL